MNRDAWPAEPWRLRVGGFLDDSEKYKRVSGVLAEDRHGEPSPSKAMHNGTFLARPLRP